VRVNTLVANRNNGNYHYNQTRCANTYTNNKYTRTHAYIFIYIYRYIHTHNITNINANPATHRTYLNNIVPSPFVVVSSPIHYNMYMYMISQTCILFRIFTRTPYRHSCSKFLYLFLPCVWRSELLARSRCSVII
jgi:hypothetical protein